MNCIKRASPNEHKKGEYSKGWTFYEGSWIRTNTLWWTESQASKKIMNQPSSFRSTLQAWQLFQHIVQDFLAKFLFLWFLIFCCFTIQLRLFICCHSSCKFLHENTFHVFFLFRFLELYDFIVIVNIIVRLVVVFWEKLFFWKRKEGKIN